ncbi:MAG TPA: 16S rRNA (adenine(1518)-N(6)/adenine(1519)-N(6))-dimethyltransferase RsmA [Thiobacillaceae bacterium]|nr:16S rRNA (adenine(1518)-N(6)/adenine(1519)-N(6))-dimethyltransferase RsmA [Thiobacillaceae bacterium]
MKHAPRKRFGQHFLIDRSIIQAIVDAIDPKPADVLVEIGPGLGALTRPLLDRVPRLHVVELDRDIIARLKKTWPSGQLIVHAGDALKFDFGSLGKSIRVCGNLPYNISSPLLFHLMHCADLILDLTFMLQKEVVDRMAARPSTHTYGRLSVMLQRRFHLQALFDVPAEAFDPPPRVTSAVVRMIPKPSSDIVALDEPLFAEIVTAAFSMRRKTLRNTLANHLTPEEFAELGIDPGLRAENLDVSDYESITLQVASRKNSGQHFPAQLT